MPTSIAVNALLIVGLALIIGFILRRLVGQTSFSSIVNEWEHGLLYVDGRFQEILSPGRHWTLLSLARKEIVKLPRWKQLLTTAPIDVVSADKLAYRLSATAIYEVKDPREANESNHKELIRFAISTALVNLAAARTLEAALSERPALDAALLSALGQPIGGCAITAMALAAVTLPPEIRRVISEAERARLEGLAALERARSEHAALRSLANAARMLKGNPELMNLRVLQALAAPGSRGQSMLVLSPTGLVPVPASGADAPEAD